MAILPVRLRRRFRWLAIAGFFVFLAPAPSWPAERVAALPEIALPDRFDGLPPSEIAIAADRMWWRVYRDPELDGLMDRLRAGNTDLAQARARLAAARAAERAGSASQAPLIGFESSAAQANGALINASGSNGSLYTKQITASWEVDLLGRLSGERAAERHEAVAAAASLADVTLLMEGELARTWFLHRQLQLAVTQAERVAGLQEEAQAIIGRRQALGLVTFDQVDAAERRAQSGRIFASDLTVARDRAGRKLGFLLGETEAPSLSGGNAPTDTHLPEIPVGLPSELLARRPDIAAARLRVMAADERLRSARKGWLPVLGLTASGGGVSTGLGQLLSGGAGSFVLGALLSLPILDSGRHKARVAGKNAELDLALAVYRERVLAALRDVNDRLQESQACRGALSAAASADQDGARLADLARLRAANGAISRIELIEATITASERRMIFAERSGECLQASVALQQALGGGW